MRSNFFHLTLALVALLLLPAPEALRAAPVPSSFVDLSGFITKTVKHVEQNLPGGLPAEREALLTGSVNGLLEVIDPSGASTVTRGTAEDPVGARVSITVRKVKGLLTVISVPQHGKAYRAGLHPGDHLLSIDGTQGSLLTVPEAEAKLHGKEGGKCKLVVHRAATDEILKFEVERENLEPKAYLRVIDGKILFVQLPLIDGKTVAKAVEFVRGHGVAKPLGLILDLRSTSGGTVDDAIALASAFLSEAPVVKVVGSEGTFKTRYTEKSKIFDAPLVILADGGTMGAAEIVMAALRENHRAVLLGDRSFGEGFARTTLPLAGGWRLRLPKERYQTPVGAEISGRGLNADIAVEPVDPPKNVFDRFLVEYDAFCEGKAEPPAPQKEGEQAQTPAKEEGDDEGEDEGEKKDEKKPRSDLDAFPLVKAHDHQLLRANNLLISTSIFFEQLLVNP